MMTGDVLTDARMRIKSDFNESYVSLDFEARGARLFDQITAENVRKRLAIVLDNSVYSAPVIQERISGGKAQITGSFTPEEASDLAIVLRAGALPAPVKIIQNVTVGPSLGQDSIDKGIRAALIGSLRVVLFMAVYYRMSVLIADWALVLNIVYLIGAFAAMRAEGEIGVVSFGYIFFAGSAKIHYAKSRVFSRRDTAEISVNTQAYYFCFRGLFLLCKTFKQRILSGFNINLQGFFL